MKKRTVCAVFILMSITALATGLTAQETLVGKHMNNGGYGAVQFSVSTLDGEAAMFTGGQGAWIINKTFLVGWSDMDMLSDDVRAPIAGEEKVCMRFDYQGFLVGVIIGSDRMVHFMGNCMIGWGRIAYEIPGGEEELDSDRFLAVIPELGMEVNVLTWMRFTVSVGYRLIRDVQMENLTGPSLSALSGNISLKFGRF